MSPPTSAIHPAGKALCFLAVLYNCEQIAISKLESLLSQHLGKIKSSFFPDIFTMDYYRKEMGENLSRVFYLLEGKHERSSLLDFKKKCMALERDYINDQQRWLNIDPGLICLEQTLLISTKPYAHRIYLSDNLYAELCHQYISGEYHSLPWTYPDYCDKKLKSQFSLWRKHLLGDA